MTDFMKNAIIREDMDIIYLSGSYEPLRGKTVLVTGAYGMLASYMVFFLIYLNEIHDYNVKIIAVSRNPGKFDARFGIYASEIERIDQSASEPMNVRCDYIVHTASFASPQHYTVCPIDVILPNVIGTYHLLDLALANKARMLYFSTCSVYGRFSSSRPLVEETDFGVLDPLDPHSCYDESKRAAESICAAYFRQKGVSVVIARIAHTYGPTMDIHNDPRVFSSFMKNAINGDNIEIKSDGLQRRSFCYLSDATTAYFKLLLEGEPGEAYNVSNTAQTVSIRELGEIVASLADVDFIHKERDGNDAYLPDQNADTAMYSSKKLEALGFSFNVGIEEGFLRVFRSMPIPPPPHYQDTILADTRS